MSRAVPKRLLAQSPLALAADLTLSSKSHLRCLRSFSHTTRRAAEDDDTRPPPPRIPSLGLGRLSGAPSIKPKQTMQDVANSFSKYLGRAQPSRDRGLRRSPVDTNFDSAGSDEAPSLLGASRRAKEEPHQMHVYAQKHNCHITIVRPPGWVNPAKNNKVSKDRTVAISLSCGNLGFRHAGRKHYDSAFQLAAYVMNRMQDSGLNAEIKAIELYLRGFGAGREAVTKALLGSEGRYLKNKIIKVADATRLKFGGTRSKKPRRL